MNTLNNRKSILITGIHGFVGRNLVRYFCNDYRIFGLDILHDSIDGVDKIFDWSQLGELPDVDVVIHLAGIAHDIKQKQKRDFYFNINTGLTRIIYDWFRQNKCSQFYFFSSVKAVADVPVVLPIVEDMLACPVGPYGESKRAAEEYILANLPGNSEGKFTYILRPAMIYGHGNKGNLNLLYKWVKTGLPWPLASFSNHHSFCSIDNVIFIVNQMITTPVLPGIYHLSDDDAISTNALVKLIAKGLDRKVIEMSVSVPIVRFLAKTGTLLRLPFNEERLRKLTENYIVSNKKIKKALHVEKLPVTVEEGICLTIKSFRR